MVICYSNPSWLIHSLQSSQPDWLAEALLVSPLQFYFFLPSSTSFPFLNKCLTSTISGEGNRWHMCSFCICIRVMFLAFQNCTLKVISQTVWECYKSKPLDRTKNQFFIKSCIRSIDVSTIILSKTIISLRTNGGVCIGRATLKNIKGRKCFSNIIKHVVFLQGLHFFSAPPSIHSSFSSINHVNSHCDLGPQKTFKTLLPSNSPAPQKWPSLYYPYGSHPLGHALSDSLIWSTGLLVTANRSVNGPIFMLFPEE